MGTLNARPQWVQTPTAGVVLSYLSDSKAALDHVNSGEAGFQLISFT
jgi:hypothetical protein